MTALEGPCVRSRCEGDAMAKAVFGWQPRFGVLAVGVALLVGFAGPTTWGDDKKPADDKKAKATKADEPKGDVRAELLKLNNVTGEDGLNARLKAYAKD